MRLFGTDGIRGVAGQYPLDGMTVRGIGRASAAILKKKNPRPMVILGRDTRESGEEIAENLKEGLLSQGIEIWDLGVIPTPGVACLARRYPVLAGVVISASHNPYQDNGIKFFSSEGTKLPDAVEDLIEEEIIKNAQMTGAITSPSLARGTIRNAASLVDEYVQFLRSTFPEKLTLSGMRIVVDCANGATGVVAAEILSSLGAEVAVINATPDGKNINHGCGALHPETVAAEVVRRKSMCGLAFDGDGDRIIFVDENGTVRDGDYLLAIAAVHLKEKGELKNNTLVSTIMANLGLLRAMERWGIAVTTTSVGDRYVYESMVASGAVLGGEQSGHIIFRQFLPTGDGIMSSLQILSVMRQRGEPLSRLCSLMKKYPQVLLNTRVSRKVPLESLALTSEAIRGAERRLDTEGRIVVRYSGTENLLRVMVEGMEKKMISDIAAEIAAVAKKEIDQTNGKAEVQ